MVIGPRFTKHAVPTTYKRITPDRGCGFILKRIYELSNDVRLDEFPTKSDVYRGSKWEGREKEGFDSLLWSALIEDGLIASEDGIAEYMPYCEYTYGRGRMYKRVRGHYENGKYVVRYQLTPKGRGVLFGMMDRIPDNLMRLNTVGSVAEFDAKKDFEELEKLAAAGAGEILQKEAVHCANLAADYAGEIQKLRAKKADMKERLKKFHEKLDILESDIYNIRVELRSIIDESEA